jgi:DNA-binding response OmpR family regulator
MFCYVFSTEELLVADKSVSGEVKFMAKIMLVDDDESLRKVFRKALEKHGHEVTDVENGREAQLVPSLSGFDLAITDFQMPHVNGIELLQWIKARHSYPVVLITGFSEIMETYEAYALGADDFITKPFHYKDALACIERLLNRGTGSDATAVLDPQYCRIKIEDFLDEQGVRFDIYIRLSGSKYVKVAHKGTVLASQRVQNYIMKGVSSLFVRKVDVVVKNEAA